METMKRKWLLIILVLAIPLLTLVNPILNTDFFQTVVIEKKKNTGLTNVGLGVFALASPKFKCSKFLNSLDDVEDIHIAWLYNTFGNDFDCLKNLLHDPRLQTLETNLINEPGHRNRRLGKYEFLSGVGSPNDYDRKLKKHDLKLRAKFFKYVAPLQKLLNEHLQPTTQCLINPGLESNVSDTAARTLIRWTRIAFPNCRVVWNPLKASPGRRKKAEADLIEGHGPNPNVNAPCLTNLDGTDINFPSRKAGAAIAHEKDESVPKNYLNSGNALQQHLEEYANKCEVAFLWVGEYNCLFPEKPWTDPRKRDCGSSEVSRVNSLVVKELLTAHRQGKIAPKEFEYTDAELLAFADCDEIKNPNDGYKKGFLIKQSEFSDRGGVILPPERFRADKIYIQHKDVIVDKYQLTGSFGHDSSGRQLWRSNKSPLKYPFKVAIKLIDGNRKVCYKTDNPRIRND